MLSGAGKYFTAGLNFKDAMGFAQQMAELEDPVHRGHFLDKKIKAYQVCTRFINIFQHF